MIHALLYTGIFLLTFIAMEGITWLTHRYVMHGFLWSLHRDHHQPDGNGFFEKNDGFFLIFAIPCFFAILIGWLKSMYWLEAFGLGVMAYGLAYFIVHDVIIHQRFKWFTHSKSPYVLGLRWAHKMHHKHLGKEDGESFGFLYIHKKYRDKIKRDRLMQQNNRAGKPSHAVV